MNASILNPYIYIKYTTNKHVKLITNEKKNCSHIATHLLGIGAMYNQIQVKIVVILSARPREFRTKRNRAYIACKIIMNSSSWTELQKVYLRFAYNKYFFFIFLHSHTYIRIPIMQCNLFEMSISFTRLKSSLCIYFI